MYMNIDLPCFALKFLKMMIFYYQILIFILKTSHCYKSHKFHLQIKITKIYNLHTNIYI
ncbi:hypothetical protein CROQUDRAFT_279187 [Cronartium quercuum f. sp. fusiforme G11]|uniref:Uncharacterized protein n=1 Tax=Cronartium quercuum f. sp. fusiforme G11 TaxID=708437 RepID=A0A9P6N9T8_9BASI|nr:hypothetical protein CROQUDRAFT_279187 [Cronartium quercuum f. sp. fusiforme G11]